MIINGETLKKYIVLLAYSLIMWLMRSSKFKKKHIKDMSADFLLRCQNSLWLEKRLNLPFEGLFFKKIFDDSISHKLREYASKKTKKKYCLTTNNCEYTFATYYVIQSLRP